VEFKVGDKVSFLNETGGGVVTKVLGSNMVSVETEDGFDFDYAIADLVKEVAEDDYQLDKSGAGINEKLEAEQREKENDAFYKKFNHLEKMVQKDGVMEVDLHIEQLIDSHRGMPNRQIVDVQLQHFRRRLREAINKRMTKAIFIHGIGHGILKSEIRAILKDEYPNLEFHDANFQRYGYGATEVITNRNSEV
jgi:DNA-nicking Smr family endonuclease